MVRCGEEAIGDKHTCRTCDSLTCPWKTIKTGGSLKDKNENN